MTHKWEKSQGNSTMCVDKLVVIVVHWVSNEIYYILNKENILTFHTALYTPIPDRVGE